MKRLNVFRCTTNRTIHGFTEDKSGSNLPKIKECTGTWEFIKEVEFEKDQSSIGVDSNDVFSSIEKVGYYIGKHEMKIAEHEIKP